MVSSEQFTGEKECMKKLIVSVIAAVVCWQVGAAVEWKNLDKEHYLGGRDGGRDGVPIDRKLLIVRQDKLGRTY